MLDVLATGMPFPVCAIQVVDGGSEFVAGFEEQCQRRGVSLFILPPRSPKLNDALGEPTGPVQWLDTVFPSCTIVFNTTGFDCTPARGEAMRLSHTRRPAGSLVRRIKSNPFTFRTGLAIAVAVGLMTGVVWTGVAREDADTIGVSPILPTEDLGVGETTIIVIDGSYDGPAVASAAMSTHRFGDMQGYYVGYSDDYRVLGVYDRLEPDIKQVACTEANDLDCQGERVSLPTYQPVELVYVGAEGALAYLSLAATAPCGDVDLRPCDARRLRELMGPSLQLPPSSWLLLSEFRTKRGAAEFMELARTRGSEPLALQVLKTGGSYAGLGQEPHPDGAGPLLGPLPDQAAWQR